MRFRGLAALPLALLLATPALAGRDPMPEERPAIEAALRAGGFERWDDIELENELWEVDDARTADGRKWDLRLRPGTLEITERRPD